jgi:hypothetical protein
MIAIFGANWLSRSWRHLPSTRDIYEPILYHVGGAGGIVKRGPSSTMLEGSPDDGFESSAPLDAIRGAAIRARILLNLCVSANRQVPSTANQGNIVAH